MADPTPINERVQIINAYFDGFVKIMAAGKEWLTVIVGLATIWIQLGNSGKIDAAVAKTEAVAAKADTIAAKTDVAANKADEVKADLKASTNVRDQKLDKIIEHQEANMPPTQQPLGSGKST